MTWCFFLFFFYTRMWKGGFEHKGAFMFVFSAAVTLWKRAAGCGSGNFWLINWLCSMGENTLHSYMWQCKRTWIFSEAFLRGVCMLLGMNLFNIYVYKGKRLSFYFTYMFPLGDIKTLTSMHNSKTITCMYNSSFLITTTAKH